MDTKKYKINISIEGKKYEFLVSNSEEELFRKAAAELNKRMIHLKSNWKMKDPSDYMTLLAFQLLFEKHRHERLEEEDKTSEDLNKILKKLEIL